MTRLVPVLIACVMAACGAAPLAPSSSTASPAVVREDATVQSEPGERPGELSRSLGAYGLRDAKNLLRPWDANIPVDDKAAWRDPRVAAAYTEVTIASDPTAVTRDPPSVRVPSGPLRDSYLLASGTRLWDAGDVRAATLVVRSALDFWSRPEDVSALRRELVHARRVEIAELAGATHLVFLDRPEHGGARFTELLRAFLDAP